MIRFFFGLAAVAWAGAACADDKLSFAPPGSWVQPVEIPAPPASVKPPSFHALLLNTQGHFTPTGDEIFNERATQILAPEALSLANIGIVWDPATESLIIHRVHVIRDGKTIDLLTTTPGFIVLRREPNLEASFLDGRLTAAMQPEGLELGDIVDLAYTLVYRDGTFKGRSENDFQAPVSIPIERIFLRAVWPSSVDMKWRESGGLETPVIKKTAQGSELTVDMTDVRLTQGFVWPPTRASAIGQLQVSDYADWRDLSQLFAPLFDKAATIAPGSSLKAEAAKIAALSPDPKVRADAALKLVQTRVRYVFLGMNLGGYVPADAEVTWRRRFGDCKGKTALLLALLRDLGVKAEPALVSSSSGAALAERLPGVRAFDHVIVRAEIGGKTYWLDGTRSGDDDIDMVGLPRFVAALPVSAPGAGLESLLAPKPDTPLHEDRYSIDASTGLDALAPVHFERIYRGQVALEMARRLARLPSADADSFLKLSFVNVLFPSKFDIAKTAFSFDHATGELHETVEGSARLKWTVDPATKQRVYSVEHSELAENPLATPDMIGDAAASAVAPDPDTSTIPLPPVAPPAPPPAPPAPPRPTGATPLSQSDPLTPQFPMRMPRFFLQSGEWVYDRTVETVTLPQGGAGFTTSGADVDKTVGIRQIKRSAQLRNGVFTLELTARTSARDTGKADGDEDAHALDAFKGPVRILAPAGYKPSAQELALSAAAIAKPKPQTAADMVDQGDALYKKGDYDGAMKIYDAALKLSPQEADAWNSRCFTRAEADRDLKAGFDDCAQALKLAPTDANYIDSRGHIYYRLHQYELALKDFDQALAIDPNLASSLFMRGILKLRLGHKGEGESNIEAAKAFLPTVETDYEKMGIKR
jgi:hypothetical protein